LKVKLIYFGHVVCNGGLEKGLCLEGFMFGMGNVRIGRGPPRRWMDEVVETTVCDFNS